MTEQTKPNFRAKIVCCDCGEEVVHVCAHKNGKLREAIIEMLTWAPNSLGDEQFHREFVAHGRRHGWFSESEDSDPAADGLTPYAFFGSQAWSYGIFGDISDARTFHGLISRVIRACGFDDHELALEAEASITRQRAKQIERREWDRMRKSWKALTREVKIGLIDAARTAASGDEAEKKALLTAVAAASPDEGAEFHAMLARYAKIQADFVDRDGIDAWIKDPN